MKRAALMPNWFYSHKTCQYKGRVFYFSHESGMLSLTELVLGDTVTSQKVVMAVHCKTTNNSCISCCIFEGRILLLSGWCDDVFAAIVDVDNGRLTEAAIHIVELTLVNKMTWMYWPFLCQISDSKVLLYFINKSFMWYCHIEAKTIAFQKLATAAPPDRGFCLLPLRLPDGRLLVAGSDPQSTDITLISPDSEPSFEKIGHIPGRPRQSTSIILLENRFVVGFGGVSDVLLNDLWIFDVHTRRSSTVRRCGKWHPCDICVALVRQGDKIYFIGATISFLQLSLLSKMIQDHALRHAFCETFGFSSFVRCMFVRERYCGYFPGRL